MRSPRTILGIPVLLALLVTSAHLNGDDVVGPKKERSKVWELSTHVLEGKVIVVRHLTTEGKEVTTTKDTSSSRAARFALTLSISKVLKGKGPVKGSKLSLQGWITGKQKQDFVPKKGDEVTTYLKLKGKKYEPLFPGGFNIRGGAPEEEPGKRSDKE
jgi:hypothetical protein